jgi:hypothetical protein
LDWRRYLRGASKIRTTPAYEVVTFGEFNYGDEGITLKEIQKLDFARDPTLELSQIQWSDYP